MQSIAAISALKESLRLTLSSRARSVLLRLRQRLARVIEVNLMENDSVVWEDMPNAARLISRFFRDLSTTGLLVSYLGPPSCEHGDPSAYLLDRCAFYRALLQIASSIVPPPKIATTVPFIYNGASWHAQAKGGYWGKDDHPRLTDMVITRAGAWSGGLDDKGYVGHLLISALDVVSRRRNVTDGLDFLFSVFKEGHSWKVEDFVESADMLLSILARQRPPHLGLDLKSTPVSEVSNAYQMLKASLSDEPEMPELRMTARRWVVQRIADGIATARAAKTADRWLKSYAELNGLTELYQKLAPNESELRLDEKAINSFIMELGADIGAYRLVLAEHVKKSGHRPIVNKPDFSIAIWFALKSIDSKNWLDLLFYERLLVPDVLKEQVGQLMNGKRIAKKPIRWPREWREFSATYATAFAAIRGGPVHMMRTELHSPEEIKRALSCHEKALPLLDAIDYIIDVEYLGNLTLEERPSYDRELAFQILSDTENSLCSLELDAQFERVFSLQGAENSSARLDTLRNIVELYPWFAHAHYELAISKDEAGDVHGALDSLETAITLEPTTSDFWRSLSVIYRKLPVHPKEHRFAQSVTMMLLDREARQ